MSGLTPREAEVILVALECLHRELDKGNITWAPHGAGKRPEREEFWELEQRVLQLQRGE